MRNTLIAGLIIIACACALVVRIDFLLRAEAGETLKNHFGASGITEGRVVNDPERRATSLHAQIRVETINGERASGRLLAILPRETRLSFGDTIALSGKITAPETFETDTGRIFDYPGYLRVRGVSAIVRYGTVKYIEEGNWSLKRGLFAAKHVFEHSLERMLPEPDNSLLQGILLGERRGLPEALTQTFIVSGLIHVVVLSGYNISIVSEAILRATSFLPRTLSYGVGGMFMILFALMTGAGATTVRALIMGLIAVLARYLRRPALALRSLGIAAVLMILWNPLVLLHDTSFILSVLATFGLIALSGAVEKRMAFVPEKFGLRSIAASTVAVQIYILPALLYFMGVLSPVSFPANILALPVVPLAMLLGFLAGLLGLAHPMLGMPLSFLADLLLRWIMLVADTATALPFSSTTVAPFPAWVALAAYVPLTAWAIFLYRRNASR